MGNRLVLVLAAAVALVAIGGIGFAAFTTSASIGGNVYAGTPSLGWSAGSAVIHCNGTADTYFSGDSPTTTISTSGSTLTVSSYYYVPGDTCYVTNVGIINTGNVPELITSVSDGSTVSGGSSCSTADWYYGQTYLVGGADIGLPAAGAVDTGGFFFGLESGVGNGCQGATLTMDLTLGASSGT
jgi:hypothetical protein